MRYTWCAGGVTFFLFLVLTFTGLLLMFYYRPTVEYAFVRHPRPARAGAVRDHARDAPVGRPRDGHLGVDPHVPRLHDGLVQAAARVQLGHRRDPARPDAAALVHRLPAAVGPARDLGHHGRLEHGPRDAAARHRGAGHEPAEDRRHPARARSTNDARVRPPRRPLRRRRRAPALLRPPLRRHPAHRGVPDGGPLLARPQGRRHLRADVAREKPKRMFLVDFIKNAIDFLSAPAVPRQRRADRARSSRSTAGRSGRRRAASSCSRSSPAGSASRTSTPTSTRSRRCPTTCRSSA